MCTESERVLNPLELELQAVVNCQMWVLSVYTYKILICVLHIY